MIKAILIILSAIVGLTGVAVMGFLIYSIAWMVKERMNEMEEED